MTVRKTKLADECLRMNQETLLQIARRSRVDQVGRLLRPQKLKDVYARHGDGKAGDEELVRIQDESVRALIAKQEALGFPILSDGEHRRLNFQDSFVESVAGFVPKKQTLQFQESRTVGGDALQRWQPDSAKTEFAKTSNARMPTAFTPTPMNIGPT